jgi:hypothetical protein
MATAVSKVGPLSFETHPSAYKHWKLTFDGPIATLGMDVQEDGGLLPDYKLKLNSYDLGVDIELNDALQRIRFEHPETHTVVVTSMRSASSAPAPTSSRRADRPMRGRSTSASSRTRRAAASKTRARTQASSFSRR